MKINLFILAAILVTGNVAVLAQDASTASNLRPVTFAATPAYYSPLYLLKADGETVEIASRKKKK